MICRQLDRLGVRLERALDALYDRASARPAGGAISAAALALGVILAGLGVFILVLFVLVTFFA